MVDEQPSPRHHKCVSFPEERPLRWRDFDSVVVRQPNGEENETTGKNPRNQWFVCTIYRVVLMNNVEYNKHFIRL